MSSNIAHHDHAIENFRDCRLNAEKSVYMCNVHVQVHADNQKDCPVNILRCVYSFTTNNHRIMIGISIHQAKGNENGYFVCEVHYVD